MARLLIVDDQPAVIQALHAALKADAHEVHASTSAAEAAQLAVDKDPDLVLLDVEMPGADGFEISRRLRSNAATRNIPIIFVTAHQDPSIDTLCLLNGNDVITKPISPPLVRARVALHLELARLRRRVAGLETDRR